MDFIRLLHALLHFDQNLGGLIAQHGVLVYAALFLVIFCEIGLLPLFFLPGDPLLFICGAFCASGAMSLWMLVPVLFFAAVLGSGLNYSIGRIAGERVYAHNYRWLDRDALRKTHEFYEKYGWLTFLLSPFIAVVRTFAPFVGGVSAMTFRRFLASVLAGAALWTMTLPLAGFWFGNIPLVRNHLGGMVLLGIGLGLGALAVAGLLKAYRRGTG
jgi:membrane-associated protein